MFNQYPYLNINDLNLDYLLKAIKEMRYEVTNFVSLNAIKYADPIQWDITRQYEKNTIVIDPLTGVAYISVQPVPRGVALTREEYWTVVFDLGRFVARAAQNFTDHYEPETTLISSYTLEIGDWVVWGDVLYKVIEHISIGDYYVVGTNIEHFTMYDLYVSYLATIDEIFNKIGDLDDLVTTDKSNLVNAINEVANEVLGKIGDLDDLTTTDKSNLVNAINEVNGNLSDTIDDLDAEIVNRTNADDALRAMIRGHIAIDATNPPEGYNPIVPDDDTVDNGALLEVLINQFPYVYIPAGTYYVTTSINIINSNRHVFGDGAILKFPDSLNVKRNMFIVIPDDAGKELKYISLHNIVLDGNRTGRGIANDLADNTLFLAFTHSAYDLSHIELDNVTMINSAGFAALFAGHANGGDLTRYFTRDIWVHNCDVHDNYGYIGTSGVESCVVELCKLYDNDCENLTFDNNSASCTLRNSIIGTSNGGIGSVGIGVCRNCLVENNEFDYHNNTTNLANYRNCITLKNTNNPAMTISIRNNTFKRATNAAIYIDYDVSSANSISAEIVNNIFNGCTHTVLNTAPVDKGIIKCDMMLGQSTVPTNTGNGNVILPPLFAIWRAVASSFVVAGDTFLNFASDLIYHKMGAKNTYGVPAILIRGYYNFHSDVSFIATKESRVAMRILLAGTTIVETNMITNIGMNSLSADVLALAQAGNNVEILLINFDNENVLTFELGRASIGYMGDLESNLTDFATF